MSTVDDAELDGIREDLEEELMTGTATVYEKLRESDGQGGTEETLKPRATDVPCGYGPLKQRSGDAEGEEGGRASSRSLWVFRMPADTVIKPTDVVEPDDGQKFEVLQIRSPRTWTLLCRFEAELFDVGGPEAEGE